MDPLITLMGIMRARLLALYFFSWGGLFAAFTPPPVPQGWQFLHDVEIGTVEGVTLKIDLVVHGDADRVVPVECSRDFVSKFQQTGGKVEYHELSGAGHNISATHPEAQDLAYAFLRKLNFPDQD